MNTLEQQLQLEQTMRQRGRDRYYALTAAAECEGRGSETSYAHTLIPVYFLPLVKEIKLFCETKSTGYLGKYKKLLVGVSPEQCAFFTLQALFNSIMNGKKIQHLADTIGKRIEDEQRFSKYYTSNPVYVQRILDSWEESRTKSYRHKVNALSLLMNRHEIPWVHWTQIERMQVGLGMLNCVTRCSDIINIKTETFNFKSQTVVYPTPECLEWITTHTERMSVLRPEFLPCIIKPKNWEGLEYGGYYSPDIQERVQLVKYRNKIHKDVLSTSNLSEVKSALNTIQSTGWTVNTRVLNCIREIWRTNAQVGMPSSRPLVVPECPVHTDDKSTLSDEELLELRAWKADANAIYTAEASRVSKCLQVVRVIKTAAQMSEYNNLYFPVQCDFRGRVYTTSSGFSPQGPDFSKALLHFSEEKDVTSDSAYRWFLIHGANTYGYDKLPLSERVQKATELHDLALEVAKNPIDARDCWKDTDSPWRFLAWCFEYSDIHTKGVKTSRIPVSLDGSCNGLQHFSAILRDPVGAVATNLAPGDRPSDIYKIVADKVVQKLMLRDDAVAKEWLAFGVTRSLTKKPVMTLPYGATKQNCVYSIASYIIEKGYTGFSLGVFRSALYLTPIVWESIEETVQAARAAMDWLKSCASTAASKGVPVQWVAPNGFPVVHAAYEIETRRINSILDRKTTVSIGTFSDRLSRHKQVNGVSPNFIHSLDAAHLMKTVNTSAVQGISSIACIHDSFGTHAVNTDLLYKIIKEEFVQMYSGVNPLHALAESLSEQCSIQSVPELGNFNINDVLTSDYLFS